MRTSVGETKQKSEVIDLLDVGTKTQAFMLRKEWKPGVSLNETARVKKYQTQSKEEMALREVGGWKYGAG